MKDVCIYLPVFTLALFSAQARPVTATWHPWLWIQTHWLGWMMAWPQAAPPQTSHRGEPPTLAAAAALACPPCMIAAPHLLPQPLPPQPLTQRSAGQDEHCSSPAVWRKPVVATLRTWSQTTWTEPVSSSVWLYRRRKSRTSRQLSPAIAAEWTCCFKECKVSLGESWVIFLLGQWSPL